MFFKIYLKVDEAKENINNSEDFIIENIALLVVRLALWIVFLKNETAQISKLLKSTANFR